MILLSHPWKMDLLRRKRLFLKHNTTAHFEKDFDATYTVLEKSVFYSAFIIRKLIDCSSKLSDEADNYILSVQKYKPLKEISINRRWPDEDAHDWDHPRMETLKGKDICNWLIHSYIFFFRFTDEIADGFFVTSDYNRNDFLCYIDINDWFKYVDFIVTDNIVSAGANYDERKKDYVYYLKRRG